MHALEGRLADAELVVRTGRVAGVRGQMVECAGPVAQVGERCVIGANSVVTEDIPPFSIAAGAPAKVLRRVEYPPGGGGSSAEDE